MSNRHIETVKPFISCRMTTEDDQTGRLRRQRYRTAAKPRRHLASEIRKRLPDHSGQILSRSESVVHHTQHQTEEPRRMLIDLKRRKIRTNRSNLPGGDDTTRRHTSDEKYNLRQREPYIDNEETFDRQASSSSMKRLSPVRTTAVLWVISTPNTKISVAGNRLTYLPAR